jgi:hypothetical protein
LAGLFSVFGKSVLQLVFLPLWRVQEANGLQQTIQTLAPTDAFSAYLKMSLMAGLIVSMPWVLLQVWNFVYLGLYPHERRFVKRCARIIKQWTDALALQSRGWRDSAQIAQRRIEVQEFHQAPAPLTVCLGPRYQDHQGHPGAFLEQAPLMPQTMFAEMPPVVT